MSPDSLDVAAEMGAAMATFVQFPIEQHAPSIQGYQEKFRAAHGYDAPPPTLTEFVYCSADADEAEQTAREYIARYFTTVMRHYEFGGTHFASTKGYQAYDAVAAMIREAGQDASAQAYFEAQHGAPRPDHRHDQPQTQRHRRLPLELRVSFAGMPYDTAEASMRLFAEEVLPAIGVTRPSWRAQGHRWRTTSSASRSRACLAWRTAISVSMSSPRSVCSAMTVASTAISTPCNVAHR